MSHGSCRGVPKIEKHVFLLLLLFFRMVQRFLSETCFLIKIIVFVLLISGSEIQQGSTRHFFCSTWHSWGMLGGFQWRQGRPGGPKMASPICIALWQKSQEGWAQLGPSPSPYNFKVSLHRVPHHNWSSDMTGQDCMNERGSRRPLKPRPRNCCGVTSTALCRSCHRAYPASRGGNMDSSFH